MSTRPRQCQYCYYDLHGISSPIKLQSLRKFLHLWRMQFSERKGVYALLSFFFVYWAPSVFKRSYSGGKKANSEPRHSMRLNLQPGEVIRVLSKEEILRTLDEKSKLRGLYFMPEMTKYCGKEFKVYKRLERIVLESTGEIRKIRDTVLLEGVLCDGSSHFRCDRSCFCFWREAWLKRVSEKVEAG